MNTTHKELPVKRNVHWKVNTETLETDIRLLREKPYTFLSLTTEIVFTILFLFTAISYYLAQEDYTFLRFSLLGVGCVFSVTSIIFLVRTFKKRNQMIKVLTDRTPQVQQFVFAKYGILLSPYLASLLLQGKPAIIPMGSSAVRLDYDPSSKSLILKYVV